MIERRRNREGLSVGEATAARVGQGQNQDAGTPSRPAMEVARALEFKPSSLAYQEHRQEFQWNTKLQGPYCTPVGMLVPHPMVYPMCHPNAHLL